MTEEEFRLASSIAEPVPTDPLFLREAASFAVILEKTIRYSISPKSSGEWCRTSAGACPSPNVRERGARRVGGS
jgi:hypothetical protein